MIQALIGIGNLLARFAGFLAVFLWSRNIKEKEETEAENEALKKHEKVVFSIDSLSPDERAKRLREWTRGE